MQDCTKSSSVSDIIFSIGFLFLCVGTGIGASAAGQGIYHRYSDVTENVKNDGGKSLKKATLPEIVNVGISSEEIDMSKTTNKVYEDEDENNVIK